MSSRVERKFRDEGLAGVARAVGRRLGLVAPPGPPWAPAVAPNSEVPTWENLTIEPSADLLPLVDRLDVDPAQLTEEQRLYREQGFLVLPQAIPHELIDRYCKVREQLGSPGGYPYTTPYMDVPEVKDLCLYPPLAQRLEALLDEPMGAHLILSGWVSTERDWHQDAYLNPEEVGGYYCAVWFALDDIHPDSGPFEYVPGSHKWGHMSRDRVLAHIPPELHDHPAWPVYSERFLTDIFDNEVRRRGLKTEKFLAKKGDILIWHTRLMHRGSMPAQPGLERRTIISHYRSIHRHRCPDMPEVEQYAPEQGGGYFFVFPEVDAGFEVKRSDRVQMSNLYLKGRGLELGALHPPGVTVDYVDRMTREDLLERYPELEAEKLVTPTIIEDGFQLTSVPDGTQDFVIANHVIEHSPDPVQAILTWNRVLRPGGVLLMAVPIADECFDKGREITTLEHHLDDYRAVFEGRLDDFRQSNRAHYAEWVNVSEVTLNREAGNPQVSEEEAAARIDLLDQEGFEIHFHTYTATSLGELLQHVATHLGGPKLVDLVENGSELIVALRKP
jgi:hypothetical protein